ncbi:hypothetical protein TraAM80_07093 [Trypanosoma rangeli]|uniref:Uncharacterized protein n=1 Tax=Trypanosoma rangeli TaxID=5698 RepID=A0A3R7MEY2_TRYRA|nr:uncharacterized protein TraAM80_07093 [Trypanosoma rangeli]RNF01296.1 hypothetical protein TraAM80_07093 [Trypanosoma rangeli]|eukprot:RNF01296.1 hypothetical protein TraAM80_07093 [Trypanosoma rangeli]
MTVATMREYSTAMRLQQYHTRTNAEFGVPECLLMELRRGIPIICQAGVSIASLSPKAASIVCREMNNMMSATSPEHRVQCISQITGALREGAFMSQRNTTECRAFLQKLAIHFVFPLMLRCEVRYLHRALATLIRTVYVMNEELETCFCEAFTASHIRCWEPETPGRRPTILGDDAASTLENATALLRFKDSIMSWVNCLDSTAVVAMPLFPRIFASTFLEILPLLGETLQWMVANASAGCREVDLGNVSGGTLLGEDLAYVRYGIRVVATYTHKFLHLLADVWNKGDAHTNHDLEEDVEKLFSPALTMLSSSAFPKDVLNGAGLLVSSLLTLRTCDPWLLLEVCRLCGTFDAPVDVAVKLQTKRVAFFSASVPHNDVREWVKLVCAHDPHQWLSEHPQTQGSLRNVLGAFTSNGRFALLRGLLAHLSTPLHGDVNSLGVLLKPITPLADVGFSTETVVVVHDIIMPAAETYCSALQAPDTRFMAIQTIDSVVRHISSVLACIAEVLDPALSRNKSIRGNMTKRNVQCSNEGNTLSESQKQELFGLCARNPKLTRTLNHATEVIMGMWDDNTLQVTGPLYDAYSEILSVHAALRRCAVLCTSTCTTHVMDEELFDTTDALQRVLCIPNERRGKYHALLGILSILPVPQFLSVLRKHFSQDTTPIFEVEGLSCFTRMLLSGACNYKIGNIAGDVFAKVAIRIRQLDHTDDSKEVLFVQGIIDPVVKSLLLPGYAAPLHLTEAFCVSSIVTHMIMPCLKSEDVFLPILLSQLTRAQEASSNFSRVNQSIVEIIHRARTVGKDVAAYLHPKSQTFQAILATLQVHETELRYTALRLCVLSTKKAETVEGWQCRMMEWYISTNMYCGGDTVAMRGLLEVFKKWMRRLVDSYKNQNNKLRKGIEGSERAAQYKLLVVDHCVRMVGCLGPQIGENASWCCNLSLERRVAAMTTYSCLLRSTLEFLSLQEVEQLKEQLFPTVLIEGLLECLSEGWEKARLSAFNLLLLYCDHAHDAIFSPRYLGDPMAAADAKAELLRARTFRKAEGEVLRYILATCFTPAAKQAAYENPLQECEKRVREVEFGMRLLKEKISKLRELGIKGACEFLQLHPLHGSLSLCAALLSNAWEVKRDAPQFYEACNMLLRCCSAVLQTCSFLVGDEPVNSTDNSEVEVDCRGHVFDKDGSCTEGKMRTVVNNTWLSIRTSASAVERVINLVRVEDLSLSALREICYVLIESLLRTKHNGVMRKLRQALKTVASVLLRSREVSYHSLPVEMLDFFLGPDGVTSTNVARMLRRSQGLPHAILAVLEAEDPTVPAILFPKAMKLLLQVATGVHVGGDDPQQCLTEEECRSQRSNALNVLTFIFENKIFASRSVANLEDAFWIAAAGFDDSSWGIRNSSLMLFSAVLPRFVGEHPSTGGVGVNTSLHDIAVRAPRALSLAYDELVKSCTRPLPSLGVFPLLQMLSMLTPDPPHLLTNATILQAPADTATDSACITRAIVRCGSSKHLMIRAASAVALTSLVPPVHLEGFVAELLSTISQSKTHLNAVHGALLHLQQFHTFYVGTLRRNVRTKAVNGNATATVALLVNRLLLEGLGAASVTAFTSTLYQACVHCPTVAVTFLSLASDVIYYTQSFGLCEKNPTAVTSLMRFGVAVVYKTVCAPTRSFELARHDHAAVKEYGTLFTLLVVGLLSLSSEEEEEEGKGKEATDKRSNAISLKESDAVWDALAQVFASKNEECLISYVMDHVSHYTAEQRWSREESKKTMRKFALRLHLDVVHVALQMLLSELSEGASLQRLSCTRVQHMKAHLEYLVLLGNDEELRSGPCEALCNAVEERLLCRMDPQSKLPLQNTEVQSWAIRFLGRCCVRHGASSATFLSVLEYYSRPFFNVQNRAAAVSALNDGLLYLDDGASATALKHRSAFFLILLRLLLDDAYDVRVDACRVVSQLTSPGHLLLDHMTCVLSLLFHIRQNGGHRVLGAELLQHYLLSEDTSHINALDHGDDENNKNADNDTGDSESEEGDVLFEKEAENMFAESSLLAYLVGAIIQEKRNNVPTFGVFDEMLRVAEQRGSAASVYATLIADGP